MTERNVRALNGGLNLRTMHHAEILCSCSRTSCALPSTRMRPAMFKLLNFPPSRIPGEVPIFHACQHSPSDISLQRCPNLFKAFISSLPHSPSFRLLPIPVRHSLYSLPSFPSTILNRPSPPPSLHNPFTTSPSSTSLRLIAYITYPLTPSTSHPSLPSLPLVYFPTPTLSHLSNTPPLTSPTSLLNHPYIPLHFLTLPLLLPALFPFTLPSILPLQLLTLLQIHSSSQSPYPTSPFPTLSLTLTYLIPPSLLHTLFSTILTSPFISQPFHYFSLLYFPSPYQPYYLSTYSPYLTYIPPRTPLTSLNQLPQP